MHENQAAVKCLHGMLTSIKRWKKVCAEVQRLVIHMEVMEQQAAYSKQHTATKNETQ